MRSCRLQARLWRHIIARFNHKVLALGAVTLATFTIVRAQSATPEAAADLFIKAWNTHDMKVFARAFTKDAIFVPLAESMDKGRAAIVKDMKEAHSTWAGATTIKRTAITSQSLSPTVSTLFFHIQFFAGGKLIPDIDRAMILVVTKKAGQWQISSGQLTKQHDGA